ncbi:MAG: hypothetical protein RSE34_00780 [Brevundimonas sp.]
MTKQTQDSVITLGGQNYTIRFSIKATLFLQEQWGLENEREVQARMAKATMQDFIDIVWAGMQRHHPELTRDQIVDILDDSGAEGLQGAVTELLDASAAPAPKGPPAEGQGTTPTP